MTLDFFVNNYSFEDLLINSITINNREMLINVSMTSHLDLIANGYRPELDLVQNKTFIFKDVSISSSINPPYKVEIKDPRHWIVNGMSLLISNDEVLVK